MSYTFSSVTGNLTSRSQRIFNRSGTCIDTLTESFTYDDLDRLLEIDGPGDDLEVSYDDSKKERIYSKSDAGALYNYDQGDPFQLESIDTATQELLRRPDQHISYTSFNKVDTLREGDYLITFDYGPNQERVRMKVTQNDTLRYTRYYFGGYELTEYPGSDTLKDTWFSGSAGVFGFHRETSSTDSIYYVIRDHLGSIMTVAGEDGGAREFFSYDAWGQRRDASDWTYDTTLTANNTTRGYTGHEHIDETYLINMNGRVYDPLVGLFLSPDPILQEPLNPLNYIRYSYVTNNPLKYTDPSGYVFHRYERIQWEEEVSKSSGGGGYHFDPWIQIFGAYVGQGFGFVSGGSGGQGVARHGWRYFEGPNGGRWLKEGVDFVSLDPSNKEFANFFNEISDSINGDDFRLSFDIKNGKQINYPALFST